MKQFIRRLSRVADSSGYILLRSSSSSFHRSGSMRRPPRRRCAVPEGHLPVYVGEEMERYMVSAELLNHPVFAGLLDKSAQEYGYEQPGALRIPCSVFLFERLLSALHDPQLHSLDADEISRLLSSEDFLS